jgi:hypothetical protein
VDRFYLNQGFYLIFGEFVIFTHFLKLLKLRLHQLEWKYEKGFKHFNQNTGNFPGYDVTDKGWISHQSFKKKTSQFSQNYKIKIRKSKNYLKR